MGGNDAFQIERGIVAGLYVRLHRGEQSIKIAVYRGSVQHRLFARTRLEEAPPCHAVASKEQADPPLFASDQLDRRNVGSGVGASVGRSVSGCISAEQFFAAKCLHHGEDMRACHFEKIGRR